MTRHGQMRSLNTLLGDFLRNFIHDAGKTELFLQELWPEVVGAQLARRTTPRRLRAGRLQIGVPTSEWQSELQPLLEGIRVAVNRFWGVDLVKVVELTVEPVSSQPDRRESGAGGRADDPGPGPGRKT